MSEKQGTAIAVRKPQAIYGDFDELQRQALALAASGYFDTTDKAKAIARVMAGAELGIAPFQAMGGIHIIEGKPSVGAHIVATLVERHPHYRYEILESTDQRCRIAWYFDEVKRGESEFSLDEAKRVTFWSRKENKRTSLADKDNWRNYPSDMNFARALTRGQRRFAPDLAGGMALYTPDELGAVDESGRVRDDPGGLEAAARELTEKAERSESGPIIEISEVPAAEPGTAEPQPEPEESTAEATNPEQLPLASDGASIHLDADGIDFIRSRCTRLGVSFDLVEEAFGCKLEDLDGAGYTDPKLGTVETPDQLLAVVLDAVNELRKSQG